MKDSDGEHGAIIFVLAGRSYRKSYAIALHERHPECPLLMSVGRFEIRRLPSLGLSASVDLVARARALPCGERHFFVIVDRRHIVEAHKLQSYRFGTLREVMGLATWMHAHREIGAVKIVSSRFHIARVRLCCTVLLPKSISVQYLAVPNKWIEAQKGRRETFWLWLTELVKLLLYLLVLTLNRPKPSKELIAVE